MRSLLKFLPLAAFVLIAVSVAAGQEKKLEARLRVNENPQAPNVERYYIEVSAVTPLQRGVYESLNSANPPTVGSLASEGVPLPPTAEFSNKLIISPEDNDRTRFRIYVPQSLNPFDGFADKDYSVLITNYPDDAGANQPRSIKVDRVFSRNISTEVTTCRPDTFGLSLEYNLADKYSLERARQLYKFLQEVRDDPAEIAKLKIRVEPLKQSGPPRGIKVLGFTLNPNSENALSRNSFISVCFETDKRPPGEKFDAELLFNSNAPVELALPPVVAGLEGVAAEESPVVFPDKEKPVGVRAIDKDLNIAGTITSSVADVERDDATVRRRSTRGTLDLRIGLFRDFKQILVNFQPLPICGRVSAFTSASQTDAGVITINGVPFPLAPGTLLTGVELNTDQCLNFAGTNPKGQLLPPLNMSRYTASVRTSATYRVFTPFYIDAKVSTGKTDKDTLSLNRIVLGAQAELRYYYNNNTFPTYYRFVFRGVNASDRDFKQAEYKGVFEFRPVSGLLNHPLDSQPPRSEDKVLVGKGTKLIPVEYGYEFVPFIGVEVGRTYLRRRPAEAIQPSDTVRRLYFGLDTVLNPTKNIAFSLSDTFYVRGESSTDRFRNYFVGEVSYGLGDFINKRAAQSVFFSFERGGQPPFDEADVNALKFGYRITATTLFTRQGR